MAWSGLSMGGYVAMAMMRLASERVGRLCRMDVSAASDSPTQASRRRSLIAQFGDRSPHLRGVTPRLGGGWQRRSIDTAAQAREIAGLIAAARLEILPGCGHLPPLEAPARVTRLLRDWVAPLAG